ncbi:hypothetical protein GIB67_005187 [Kingdonia uniflora]|uniref:Cytochrome P450 n=1 Tax=Kingdonia uniflora TaxID=39325 RepID=A0A7J7NN16_9MAGN|nr:hypothetical protein GIB67_005187 [Kingdonia uniflora]
MLNMLTTMLWGGTLKGEERRHVGHEFKQVVDEVNDLMGKSNISDLLPFLAWFDLQGMELVASWLDRIFESTINERMKLDGAGSERDQQETQDFLQVQLQLRDRGDPKMPLTTTLSECSGERDIAVAPCSTALGTLVFVNAWAIQRDPKVWENPLEFKPERFMRGTSKWDYSGNDFRYIPFGSGRRTCAGIGVVVMMLPYFLASFVHLFEWQLPEDVDLDFSEKFGGSLKKQTPLIVIPRPRFSKLELYCENLN